MPARGKYRPTVEIVVRVPAYIGWPLVAASSYGALCFWASRAVYYPMKHPQGLWDLQSQSGAHDVWLGAADGVRIHGWWIPSPESRLATLFLHGNAGNLTHRAGHIREITAAGSSLLIIDYRGYGRSEGRPSERGLYADAEAGYRYLLDAGHGPKTIVVHGESLGTAVAVDLAARHECGGVILEAPFTSAREVGSRVLPLIGPLITWGFDSKQKIPNVRAPVTKMLGKDGGRPLPNVHLIEPLPYLPFVALMDRSTLILTDSGGIQEEAPSIGKPVLVLRDTSERPEAITVGTAKLVGTSREGIVRETARLLTDEKAYAAMSRQSNPYGDGKAAKRIVGEIIRRFR